MARYFSQFPVTMYNLGDNNTAQNVVKLTANYELARQFKDNTVVYYSYVVQDGDTPEMLAYKIYGDVEKHWIILFMNDIVDPQVQWPFDQRTLIDYIENKYKDQSPLLSGLDWAKANIKSYYKVEQVTYNGRTKTEQIIEIDKDQYDTIVPENNSLVLEDGTVVSVTTTKTTKTYYQYEVERNESKRTIKILNPEFSAVMQQELVRIFTEKTLEAPVI